MRRSSPTAAFLATLTSASLVAAAAPDPASPAAVAEPAPEPSSERSFALVPIRVEGNMEHHWRVRIEEELFAGLSRSDARVLSTREVAAKVDAAESCASPECFTELAAKLDVDYLVTLDVVRVDRDFTTKMRVIDGSKGSVLIGTEKTCEMCGIGEVADLVADQAAGITAKLESLAVGPAAIAVDTRPKGATVSVDGKLVGTTPLRHEVADGVHEVHITLDGHESRTVRLTSVQGVEESLSFTLEPSNRRQLYMQTWGWTTLALGAGTVVAGGVLLGIDGEPYKAQCSGANIDGLDRCRFQHDTVTVGSLVTVAGVALVGTGIALLIVGHGLRGKRAKAREKRSNKGKGGSKGRGAWLPLSPVVRF